MKSGKLKYCLLTLPLFFVAVAAIGCGSEEHTHTYSSDWAFNAESHWHPSTCSHDAKTQKSGHDYVSTVVPPSVTSAGYTLHTCVCGYSYISDSVDSLPVQAGLRYNENGHWSVVLSGEQITVEDHVYEDISVAPTCSTYGYTKHTCKCGYWYASDTTEPISHTYHPDIWEHDENSHWHPASCCDSRSGITAHDYTQRVTPATCDKEGYTEFICKDCDYTYRGRITPASHTYADVLIGDEYEHWRAATCGHDTEKTDVAEHALVGTSNVCEVCRKAVAPRLAYELSENGEYYIVTGIGCFNESAVTIPATYRGKPVQEIGVRAFKGADITSVTFGENVKKVGDEAFAGTQISAAALPGGIEEIGTKAFAQTKITSLVLGESLQAIGQAAFRGCAELETAEIKSDLTVLPSYAFEGCSSLQSVICKQKLTEVGAQAFFGCAQLTALDLSACEKIGFSAFADCSDFAPTVLDKLSVAEDYAFSGCAIETATLPATLTQIGASLFSGCENLKTVTINAASIGSSAFAGCGLLDSVTLHGTELIGEGAFAGCSNLATLVLPDTVVRVGANAFKDTQLISIENGVHYAANVVIGVNGGVSAVTVKAGVLGIADDAFRGSKSLRTVALDEVRFIGVSAFRGCTGVKEITFTPSVKVIGANAFRESGLTSVTVPATVSSVGDNAFYDCKSLTSVTVNAKEIGRFAFSYTGVNRTLTSPVKERPDYAKLASVTLGSGVTVIGSNAFQYCPITSVTLPESLTTIGKYAFAQTNLNSITIPAAVTRIGEYAFYDCKLTSATFADAQNWKAGKKNLSLGSATQNAAYLTNNYMDIDWIKG